MAEDVIFREPQLVHHGDKAVIDPFFAIIVRIASCAVIFVKGAYPLHSTRHTPSPIERAALRTLNAACKRIDILGSCSGESLLAFLDKLLNSIEHILVNDTGMCFFGIEAIFLSAVDMLVEWDRCFTVSFLIETIADIPFIFQHIGYSVRMPALLAGLGIIKKASFNVEEELHKLMQKLFNKPRTKTIISMRSRGKTLEETGQVLHITRERVRQIEAKAKREFSYSESRRHYLLKISALRNCDDILTATELKEYFGEYYVELLYLFRTYESQAFYYDEQLDSFVIGDNSLGARIQEYIESLPDTFSDCKLAGYIDVAEEDFDIPKELACIEPQIQSEKDYITYHALKTKLDDSQFTAAIQSVLSDNGITSEFGDVSVQLANKLRKLLLDKDWSDFSVLFGLSAEDERQVLSVIERVFRSDSNALKNYKRRINSSITRSKELRDVLQNSSIDSFEEFSKARVDKELEQQRLEVDLQHLYTEESSLLEEIQFKQNNLAVAKKAFEESLKKESMAAITGRLVLLLEDLQDYLFRKLIAAVEHDLKMKFGQLIRKKNFFDDIVIDRTWNVHIIRNESVAIKDILALLEKKDLKVIDRKLGSSAVSFLLDHYKVKNANELHYKLSMSRDVQIQLPVEVEKDRMSSGEKQIFVMSLYWALMQQSKNALPFIIDTPFARIDTEHRHNITENFFKKLTGQLFVLSTDEELSGDHLGVMKEQISHVYMLDYGSDHKTHVKADQYFEV